MKVLHLVESLDRGGLERIVISLVLAQRAGGDDVAVCCLFHPGKLAHELLSAGVRVTSASKTAGLDFRALKHVRSELARHGATVLHTHNAVANYYGALAAIGTDVRLVNTRHGMGFIGRPGRREYLYRLSLLRTTAVAMVCDAARRHFVGQEIVPDRLAHVVRNGIVTEHFASIASAARANARRLLDLPADAFVIGTVGRLSWAKNHALLIESFALFAPTRPWSRLLIVGNGELQASLLEQIGRLGLSECVLLAGDRDDVHELLPAMDVFAMTSTTEGYSVALLEAAAAGLPVLATDVGGNAEIVQHGVTGQLLSEPTAAAFADALALMANDAVLRQKMGTRAREWIERHGSTASMSQAYGRLYSSLHQQPIPARVAA